MKVLNVESLKGLSAPLSSKGDLQEKTTPRKASTHYSKPDPVLQWMYVGLCYLCFCMCVWILVAPASWLISRSRWHQEVMLPFMRRMDSFRVTPEHVITKYQVHGIVHFTHIAPAAIWSAIAPFQLHPNWRDRHRTLHRLLGYLFLATALPIACGVLIIVDRKLTFGHSFPELPPQNLWTDSGYPPFLTLLACWFAGTVLYAIYLARHKRYMQHRIWMIRHIAGGIFVAVQRFVYIPLCILVLTMTHPPPKPISPWLQREIFGGTAVAAGLTAILLGEWAVYRICRNSRATFEKSN